MKMKLLSLLAGVSMMTAAGIGLSAAPASAAGGAFVSGCTLVQSGVGSSTCDFIGVGPLGSYQLTVELGSATLTIVCGGRTFTVTANGATTPGANEGDYTRNGLTTNSCTATLKVTGSSLSEATATFT